MRSRIEKDIKPRIGHMKVEDVRPTDVDGVLQAVIKRGAPTIANDVLRWMRRMFDFAIKRHIVQHTGDVVDQGKEFVDSKKSVLREAFEAGREAMKHERDRMRGEEQG